MQTFGSRNRFAENKTPFAKKKRKFIFKKIGEIFGDGSGVALALPNKGVSAHQELCLESSETVPDTRQKVRKTSQKSIGNPAKKCQKSDQKVPEILSKSVRNSVKKVQENLQKKCPKSDRPTVRNGENNGKTSAFLPQGSQGLAG
jgi:hypothetical protein